MLLLLSHFSRVRLCATLGQQPTRLLCPRDSPGKNTGVGCHFLLQCMHACEVASVASDSMRPHGQQPTRLLCPRDSLGKNTGVGCHTLIRKIMASGPITSWQIDGETVETVAVFIFLGSKITADGDCSHETLVPWKKSYDKPRQHY